MSRSLLVAVVVTVGCSGPAKPAVSPIAPNPPVAVVPAAPPTPAPPTALSPPQPTLRLPRNFVPTSYAARLAIDPSATGFTGEIAITGTISEPAAVIWLHARKLAIKSATVVQAASVGAAPIAVTATPVGEDLLKLEPATPLAAGAWTFAIAYSGEYDSLDTAGAFKQTADGEPYVFSQFEAVYARRVFPCFDEPDVKVPWTITLDIPTALIAVSNAPVASQHALDDTHTRVEFAPTKPLPSYLIAFGVGPFDVVDAGKTAHGAPVRIIALHHRAKDAAYAASITAKIVDTLEAWFDRPYPFDKIDILTVPLTTGFSAMENAGLVTFTETAVLFDPVQLSWGQRHRYAIVAAHELAHQWFGDLVTTAWWDDIWLNEGFADWMERKIVATLQPAWLDGLADLDERHGALDADSLSSARRVRQPIATADDILNVFDGITYAKGASVLNMFESYLGPELFQRGVRQYLADRAYGAATSADFIAAISKVAGQDVGPAFSSFLEQSGAPEITATIDCTAGQPPRIALAQRRYVPPGAASPPAGTPWIVPVCVAYDRDGKRANACTLLAQPTGVIALDPAPHACPRWLLPNVDGRGYYHSALTSAAVIALRDEAWPMLTWTERRFVFGEVANAAHLGQLPLTIAMSFVPKLLVGGDRFTIGDAIGLPSGLDGYVPDALRASYDGWLRRTFAPAALALGMMPRAGDDLNAESVRRSLVGVAAHAGVAPLIADAVKLAGHWRDLPASARGSVLAIAANANADVFARLLADVHTEKDRTRRRELINAVASVGDLGRQRQALALVLDPALDPRETLWILYGGRVEANHAQARAFGREHVKEILARFPKDATTGGGAFAGVFTNTCRADQRDEVAAFVQANFAQLPGATRELAQQIEEMDQCIARRALLEPEIRGWLGGVKANGPDPLPVDAPAPAGKGKRASGSGKAKTKTKTAAKH